MDDDLWHEEQIKKKKRLILLMLLALLVVTAGAAALLEPTPPDTVAALETSPSPRTTDALTATLQVQGDEWLQPTLPGSVNAGADASQTATATVIATENDKEASSPDSTPTSKGQQKSEIGLPPPEPGSTPSSLSTRTGEATPDLEINPTTLIPSQTSTAIAEVSPSTDPGEADVSLTATPIRENDAPANTSQATLIPTEISRRINESWDVLNGSYLSTAEVGDASLTLTAITTLTNSPNLSETVMIVPPEGLPVTGISSRRGMNWGAMIVVVLLLGAGTGALLYPQPNQK